MGWRSSTGRHSIGARPILWMNSRIGEVKVGMKQSVIRKEPNTTRLQLENVFLKDVDAAS